MYLAEVFSERALLFREIFCIMCYKKRNRPVHVSVDCKKCFFTVFGYNVFYTWENEIGSQTLIARAFQRALTMAREYVIMESLYEVWSIDTKIINIDRTHNLEKRTEAPLKISDAVSKAVKLEGQGHIIELRKVS